MSLRILLVENNKEVAIEEKEMLLKELKYDVDVAYTYKEVEQILKVGNHFVALLNINLSDAPNGEIVDLVAKEIPSIVFTTSYDEGLIKKLLEKEILDYSIKTNIDDFKQVIADIKRLELNKNIKILVVDDSMAMRKIICSILNRVNFTTLEAKDGLEALDVLKENSDIKMVITDNNMPKMEGVELVQKIRAMYGKDKIAIIGLSASNSSSLSTRFIKYGASDFLAKPFAKEELYVRVIQNIELLEKIEKIRSLSDKDFLTGIYNRRYFFNNGEKLYENAKRNNLTITIAMLDIDHFKKINDTYGHHMGDLVIKSIAKTLDSRFRGSDLVARFGGEEFCVMVANMAEYKIKFIFEQLREKIANTIISENGIEVRATCSIGINTKISDNLNDMINKADEMLYKAKENGRNQVQIN